MGSAASSTVGRGAEPIRVAFSSDGAGLAVGGATSAAGAGVAALDVLRFLNLKPPSCSKGAAAWRTAADERFGRSTTASGTSSAGGARSAHATDRRRDERVDSAI